MTRTSYRSVTKSLKKRSSTFDLQGPNKKNLIFQLAASSPPPSASCLNNLFSDLSVTRTASKRLWGNFAARSQRCAHLVSLVEQSSSSTSSKSHRLCKRDLNRKRNRNMNMNINMNTKNSNQLSSSSSSSTSATATSSTCSSSSTSRNSLRSSSRNPSTAALTTLLDNNHEQSSASWGYFVEAEEEQVQTCA
jgi:hypothetical protein